jgi:hypothetical protein
MNTAIKKIKFIVIGTIGILVLTTIIALTIKLTQKSPVSPTVPQVVPKAAIIQPTINLESEIEQNIDKIPETMTSVQVSCGDPSWNTPIISNQPETCFDPIFTWQLNTPSTIQNYTIQGYNIYWTETNDPINISLESGAASMEPFTFTNENKFRPYEYMKMETGKTYYLSIQTVIDNKDMLQRQSRQSGELLEQKNLTIKINKPIFEYKFSGNSPEPETVSWLQQ